MPDLRKAREERREAARREIARIDKLLAKCDETEQHCVPPARIEVVREVRRSLKKDREKAIARLDSFE